MWQQETKRYSNWVEVKEPITRCPLPLPLPNQPHAPNQSYNIDPSHLFTTTVKPSVTKASKRLRWHELCTADWSFAHITTTLNGRRSRRRLWARAPSSVCFFDETPPNLRGARR